MLVPMLRSPLWIVCGALALAGCEPDSPPRPAEPLDAAARGEDLFQAYCSPCHGAQARGDGPRAATTRPRPADLTGIAARNGDLFIADAVAAYVDGRKYVDAHGPTDMPAWGRELDDRNQALDQESKLTEAMIRDIVAYLETLQRKPTTP